MSVEKPTRFILLLIAGFLCTIPLSFLMVRVMSQGQDPAGQGMITGMVMIFVPTLGAVGFGVPAVLTARKHRREVHFVVRAAAWILLLCPALVIAGAAAVALAELWHGWRTY